MNYGDASGTNNSPNDGIIKDLVKSLGLRPYYSNSSWIYVCVMYIWELAILFWIIYEKKKIKIKNNFWFHNNCPSFLIFYYFEDSNYATR